jgi:hypothetical protein
MRAGHGWSISSQNRGACDYATCSRDYATCSAVPVLTMNAQLHLARDLDCSVLQDNETVAGGHDVSIRLTRRDGSAR